MMKFITPPLHTFKKFLCGMKYLHSALHDQQVVKNCIYHAFSLYSTRDNSGKGIFTYLI